MSKRILFLEPYYGGSRKSWFEGLERFSTHKYESITLPAKHWKWRMSSAASIFADKLSQHSANDNDLILCSEFLSINRLRGELSKEWQDIPIACYFHENKILSIYSLHNIIPKCKMSSSKKLICPATNSSYVGKILGHFFLL